jgi:indole-3-glycerol phosphate synthase
MIYIITGLLILVCLMWWQLARLYDKCQDLELQVFILIHTKQVYDEIIDRLQNDEIVDYTPQ